MPIKFNNKNGIIKKAADAMTVNLRQQQLQQPYDNIGIDDKEAEFKKNFQQLATDQFNTKAKKFLDYVEDFIVIEVEPEKNYGFGCFELILGEEADQLFVPIIMQNSSIKPILFMYNDTFDILPFDEKWFSYIQQHRAEQVLHDTPVEEEKGNPGKRGPLSSDSYSKKSIPSGPEGVSLQGILTPPTLAKNRAFIPGTAILNPDNPMIQNTTFPVNPVYSRYQSYIPKYARGMAGIEGKEVLSILTKELERHHTKVASLFKGYEEQVKDSILSGIDMQGREQDEVNAFINSVVKTAGFSEINVPGSNSKFNPGNKLKSAKTTSDKEVNTSSMEGLSDEEKQKIKNAQAIEAKKKDPNVKRMLKSTRKLHDTTHYNELASKNKLNSIAQTMAGSLKRNPSLAMQILGTSIQSGINDEQARSAIEKSNAATRAKIDLYKRKGLLRNPKTTVKLASIQPAKLYTEMDDLSKLASEGVQDVQSFGMHIDNPNTTFNKPMYLYKKASDTAITFPTSNAWKGYIITVDGELKEASLIILDPELPVEDDIMHHPGNKSSDGSILPIRLDLSVEAHEKYEKKQYMYIGFIEGNRVSFMSKTLAFYKAEKTSVGAIADKYLQKPSQDLYKPRKKGNQNLPRPNQLVKKITYVFQVDDSTFIFANVSTANLTRSKDILYGETYTMNFYGASRSSQGVFLVSDKSQQTIKEGTLYFYPDKKLLTIYNKELDSEPKSTYKVKKAFSTPPQEKMVPQGSFMNMNDGVLAISRVMKKHILDDPFVKVATIKKSFYQYYVEEDNTAYNEKELFLKLASAGYSTSAIKDVLTAASEGTITIMYPNMEEINKPLPTVSLTKVAQELREDLRVDKNEVLCKVSSDLADLGVDIKSKYVSALSGLLNLSSLNIDDGSLQQLFTEYVPELVKSLNLVGRILLVLQLSELELANTFGVDKTKNMTDTFNKIFKALGTAASELNTKVNGLNLTEEIR